MRPKEPRVPYAGLVRWLTARYGLEQNGYRTIAKTIGMSERNMKNWHHHGIPLFSADKLAVKLGAHPADIWPDEWWNR